MTLPNPLSTLEALFTAETDLDALLTMLMPALCNLLKCDRCFFYRRDPATGQGQITHCYCRSSAWENLAGAAWIEDPEIASKDPLMALAFRSPEAVYVEDIETAGPAIVNLTYEQEQFGHRALIHAPIYHNGLLHGIVEPCVFAEPRVWTAEDRSVIAFVQQQLSALIAEDESRGVVVR